MIKISNLPRAYTECIEILNHVAAEDYNKVPSTLIENMYNSRDKDYDFKVDTNIDFKNQKMMDETKAIFAVIFRDYWATQDQRERMLAKEKKDLIQIEAEKRKKYNPDDIFKKIKIN